MSKNFIREDDDEPPGPCGGYHVVALVPDPNYIDSVECVECGKVWEATEDEVAVYAEDARQSYLEDKADDERAERGH